MRLGDLVDMAELKKDMDSRYILMRRHPHLPLAILNYSNSCMFDNYWSDAAKHCRGLIINPVSNHEPCGDCEIVSRPFHKFFNLNQTDKPETFEANLPAIEPTVTEKMDGWFGILWKCALDGDSPLSMVPNWSPETKAYYGIASRGSFDSIGARFGTDKLRKLIKYGAIHEFPEGYSAVFEIIAKECKIVVDYPYDGLVLLALINNETGEEMPYDDLRNVWAKIASYSKGMPWIRLVHAHKVPNPLSLASAVSGDNVIDTKNREGFVLSYPRPGTWPIKVKVKLEEYKRLHKLITGVTPQQIWQSVHDPMAPWMGGGIPDHFRKWALTHRDRLYSGFHAGLRQALSIIDSADISRMSMSARCGMEDRDFRKTVFKVLQNLNPDYANVAMDLIDGNIYAAHQSIWNSIRPVGREEVFYREGQGE